MDWNLAIERNREALKRIVAMLAAMAGFATEYPFPSRGGARGGGDFQGATRPSDDRRPLVEAQIDRPTLPRHLHRAVLRLLRPAESAARRLVIVMARGLAATPRAGDERTVVLSSSLRPRVPKPTPTLLRKPGGTGIFVRPGIVLPSPLGGEGIAGASACGAATGQAAGAGPRAPGFQLFDPLRRPFRLRRPAQSGVPRISFPGFVAPSPIALRRPPKPDDPLDATRIASRLRALAAALDDLPRQARRFARWRDAQKENHDAPADAIATARRRTKNRRVSPLRQGRPPGGRRRPRHEVHRLLNELHGLAREVLEQPDTS